MIISAEYFLNCGLILKVLKAKKIKFPVSREKVKKKQILAGAIKIKVSWILETSFFNLMKIFDMAL